MDENKIAELVAKAVVEANKQNAQDKGGNESESDQTKGTQGNESQVQVDLAEKIAKKLTDAIMENKHLAESERAPLNDHVKTKIFTSFDGLKEVEYPSDLKSLSKDEKIVNFFKALYYSKADPQVSGQVLRALVEGTDAEGGYLVPEELKTEVLRILPDMAVMRKIARTVPMTSNSLKINALTAKPKAYWTAEYQSKSTTSAELGQVELNPNDLVCLLPVTDQLIADANINIVQFIIELFAEAIAEAEDKAFFTGDGSGKPRGISQETITEIDAGGSLHTDDIIDLVMSKPQAVRKSSRAAIVYHQRSLKALMKLKDTDGAYMWRNGGKADGSTAALPDTLFGYPAYEQNDINDEHIYFGDWGYYLIGDRQTISVRTTQEGGDAWRRNATEIKAVERVDGQTALTSAFSKITNAH